MSKKKPRSKDPHSWIKDTTKKAAGSKPAEKPEPPVEAGETPTGPEEETASPEHRPQQFVMVKYDKKDGHILATHRALTETQGSAGEATASVSEDRATARIALTGELLDKQLLDIHENYKVVISKKKPTLVPKD